MWCGVVWEVEKERGEKRQERRARSKYLGRGGEGGRRYKCVLMVMVRVFHKVRCRYRIGWMETNRMDEESRGVKSSVRCAVMGWKEQDRRTDRTDTEA